MNILMAVNGGTPPAPVLPYKQRVNYLESTGSEWIDTGVKPTTDAPTIEMQFMPMIAGDWDVCGWPDQVGLRLHADFISNGTYMRLRYGTETITDTGQAFPGVDLDVTLGVNSKVNNTSYTFSVVNFAANTQNIRLFAGRAVATTANARIRLYSAKIYLGSTLVRNFIPVIDWEDRPALYDLVSETLFYNASGNGAFRVPGVYKRQLASLTGTGTQYINTSLPYFPDFEIEGNGVTGLVEFLSASTGKLERISASNTCWGLACGSTSLFSTVSVYEKHKLSLRSETFSIDNTTIGTIPSRSWAATDTCVMLAAPNAIRITQGTIYYCKFYNESGDLVLDLIPVLDLNDTPCLYDKVNGDMYYNQGTGEFNYEELS